MKRKGALLAIGVVLAGCGRGDVVERPMAEPAPPAGTVIEVAAATRSAMIEAAGVAEPYAQATLSTKLMATVQEVAVREGDRVRAGQLLVRLDARDLAAKAMQIAASLAEAEAAFGQALTHAERMRALYADEAAPKAQLDAAETALASAEARVAAVRAAAAELDAMRAYSEVHAPFSGTVTARHVDPGAFAAPGAPLVTVQDPSRLRVSVTTSPETVRGVTRGDMLRATIEGFLVDARVEGVVPAAGGNLYTVNAIVDNRDGRFLAGSAATLGLPAGERTSIVVPVRAVVRQGDLTGLHVQSGERTELRWVRLGVAVDDSVEVLSGLRGGERVVVPAAVAEAR